MSKTDWGRPGIIPGLHEGGEKRRPPPSGASSGLFGFVADPNDSKTPPGIGDQCPVPEVDSQLAQKPSVVEEPLPSNVVSQNTEPSPQVTSDLLIRGGKLMGGEEMYAADVLVKNGKINAIGENLRVAQQIPEIDATNLVIGPGLVDFSATSHAFSSKLGADGMADPALIREATSRAVLCGATTIIDTVYTDDGQSPLSAIAAYLQALKTTYVHCNVAVRAGIRHLTISSISDIETLVKRHHVKSFLLAISENDQILCENGSPESTVLYGVLCACRGLGILPTIGLDKITGSWIPQSEGDAELRLASIAITIAKLAGCPIILSPVRRTSVMHKIYTSQHDNQPLFIYADVAALACHEEETLHGLAPYIAADENVILSSGESFILPNQPSPPGGSWTQRIHQNIVRCGWANDRHITEASSKRPAQLAGLCPHKGHLTIGADADLVLWSEDDRSKPIFTVVGGRIAVQYSQLRNSTPRDRENGNAIKAGYIVPEQGPCDSLTAIQDMIKELGKALQPALSAQPSTPPPSEKATNKSENERLGPSGDVAAAGLPTREMRSIASQYKRDSLASTFKLTGEQQGDDRPLRPNIKIWQGRHDSPRPY